MTRRISTSVLGHEAELVGMTDHAEIGLVRLRGPQGVHEVGLLRMLTERQPVNAADRREILRGFGSDLQRGQPIPRYP